ncbi:MAG: FHA domain-containing protein [Ignavibacteriae bacterium]|nr:MAG: FHA domain-containing protein [Ignavibacteriota bacterium]
MKKIYALLAVIFITYSAFCQDSISVKIRDVDISKFQKLKLYVSITDINGKAISNLDSSNFSITEAETGKTSNPSIQNFFNSPEPMAILIAIDASHSMDGDPLNNVKAGLLKTLTEFRKDDKMGIAYFHDDFVKQASFDTDRDVLKNNIDALHTAGSSTELFKGTIESIKWLKSLPEPKRKILIVISDGEDNGSQYILEDVINEIKNSGISVFTIGSTEKDRGFLANMDKIAHASVDGKYYKITGPQDIKLMIPAIYERIKEEYVINYFSYAAVNLPVNPTLDIKTGNKIISVPFKYTSPAAIVEFAPTISFWKSKEFLYGSIGAGAVIIVLAVFMFINMSKKKKFRLEKEEERRLREEEAQLNREKFDKFKNEYDGLLDRLESQMTISQADKDRIAALEGQLETTGKTLFGEAAPKIDIKRRTMILEKGSYTPVNEGVLSPTLLVKTGALSGKRFKISAGTTTIGRQSTDIIISDTTVSRNHARIYFDNSKFYIEDNSSTNGTFVNNFRVSASEIKPGDIIKVGNVELLFSKN